MQFHNVFFSPPSSFVVCFRQLNQRLYSASLAVCTAVFGQVEWSREGLNITFLRADKQDSLQTFHQITKLKFEAKNISGFQHQICFIAVWSPPNTLLECHWRPSKKAPSALACLHCMDLRVLQNGKNLNRHLISSTCKWITKAYYPYKQSFGTSLDATWLEGWQKRWLARTLHKTAGASLQA